MHCTCTCGAACITYLIDWLSAVTRQIVFARALPHYAGHNGTPCRPSYPLYPPPSKPLSFLLSPSSFPSPYLLWKSSRSREPTSRLGFLASRVHEGNTILVKREIEEGEKERERWAKNFFSTMRIWICGAGVDFCWCGSKYRGDFVDRWRVIRREAERRVIGEQRFLEFSRLSLEQRGKMYWKILVL